MPANPTSSHLNIHHHHLPTNMEPPANKEPLTVALQEFSQAMDKLELQAQPPQPALTNQAQAIKPAAQLEELELPLSLAQGLAQLQVQLQLELPPPPLMAQLQEELQEPLQVQLAHQELPRELPMALQEAPLTELQEAPLTVLQATPQELQEPPATDKEPLEPHMELELQAVSPALNQEPHTVNQLAAAFPPPLAAKATPQPTKEPQEPLEPLALPQADSAHQAQDSAHPEQDPQVHPTTPSKPKNIEQ